MYALKSRVGCIFPVHPPCPYGVLLTKGEEENVASLELIHKHKNGFGDMYYYIRDQNGVTSQVYEGDLEEFLRKKGTTLLKEGVPFTYPQKSKR